jgi:membrane protein YqaA with SNARE-associated domain
MIHPEFIETAPENASERARATRNPLRKLYFWTLHWAATPHALPALVLISFAESSFFPIPPDVLLMALCFSHPGRWMSYAAWCTIASVAGGVLGWYLGWGFWQMTQDWFFRLPGITPELFTLVEGKYNENAFLALLTAAFTPIPFKVFTVASGVFAVSLWTLVAASILGRGARFFLVAGLIRKFGPVAKPFLEKHFELCTLAFLALGILGFLAVKLLS